MHNTTRIMKAIKNWKQVAQMKFVSTTAGQNLFYKLLVAKNKFQVLNGFSVTLNSNKLTNGKKINNGLITAMAQLQSVANKIQGIKQLEAQIQSMKVEINKFLEPFNTDFNATIAEQAVDLQFFDATVKKFNAWISETNTSEDKQVASLWKPITYSHSYGLSAYAWNKQGNESKRAWMALFKKLNPEAFSQAEDTPVAVSATLEDATSVINALSEADKRRLIEMMSAIKY